MSKTTKNKGGRPPLAEEVARLEVRVPRALLALVEERAKRQGVPVAEWVRAALHRALGEPSA